MRRNCVFVAEKCTISTPPRVDLKKLAELECPQLIELLKLYVHENEALRKENAELFSSRELLLRDQEVVSRENERLLKKLEDVNKYVFYFLPKSFNTFTYCPIQTNYVTFFEERNKSIILHTYQLNVLSFST